MPANLPPRRKRFPTAAEATELVITTGALVAGGLLAWSLLGFQHFTTFITIVLAAGMLAALIGFTLEE